MFPPRLFTTPLCFLPGTTTNLQSVLFTMTACFLPGTTLTHQSVLFTIACVFPPRQCPYSSVCALYYALHVSSQALTLLSSLCCLLYPVCFLPGTIITLHTLVSAVYYALCDSSEALPSHCSLFSQFTMPCLFFPKHYHYTGICAEYFLCHVCFLPGTTITLPSVLFTIPCIFPPGTTTTL